MALGVILNAGTFALACNKIIGSLQEQFHGRIGATLINGLISILPTNNIVIPEDIYINYAMDPYNPVTITASLFRGG